jgi:hypothetical protein
MKLIEMRSRLHPFYTNLFYFLMNVFTSSEKWSRRVLLEGRKGGLRTELQLFATKSFPPLVAP